MFNLTVYGIQLWEDAATLLNDTIRFHGKLPIDDRSIWDGILHRWTNEDWILVIAVAERCIQRHPRFVRPGLLACLQETKRLLLTYYRQNHRVLDQRQIGQDHKRAAWRCMCSLRELWNDIHNIDLPTRIQARSHRRTRLWNQRT